MLLLEPLSIVNNSLYPSVRPCLVGEGNEGEGLWRRGRVLHGAAEERHGRCRTQEGQVDGHT